MWEETSYRLECLQANSSCIEQEWTGMTKNVYLCYPTPKKWHDWTQPRNINKKYINNLIKYLGVFFDFENPINSRYKNAWFGNSAFECFNVFFFILSNIFIRVDF